MNLSNYSPEAAVDEAIQNRASVPELLRYAASLNGVAWVLSRLVETHGLTGSAARLVLRSCGLIERAPLTPRPAVERLLATLRRDLPKLSPTERAVIMDTFIAYEKEHPVVAP